MKLKEQTIKLLGVFVLVIGAVFALSSSGLVDFGNLLPGELATAQTEEGTASIDVSSNFGSAYSGMLFSTVTPGKEYKWEVTITNTGDVAWDGWYTLRMSKSSDNPDISNIGTTRVQEEQGAKSLVLTGDYRGSYTENDVSLRDNLVDFDLKKDGSRPSYDSKVATLNFPTIQPGGSRTFEFTMNIPQNIEYRGERTLVGNAVAWSGAAYVIDSNKDVVSYTGIPTGRSALVFGGGIAASMAGLALAIGGRFW